MDSRLQNESGIALVVVVIALIVTGALLMGVSRFAILEHRQAQNTGRMGQAFSVAEFGLNEALANWQSGSWNSLPIMGAAEFSGQTPAGTGSFDGSVQRLNGELFLLDVTGISNRLGVRQRLGAFARLLVVNLNIQAALTTRGETRIGGVGTTRVSGTDSPPVGWGSCDGGSDLAGLRVQDESLLETFGGCNGADCISGSDPPVEADPTMSDETFFQFGDADWNDLVAMASKTLAPGNYRVEPTTLPDGTCDTAQMRNWGHPEDPASPCFNYFPVVYVPGDLTVNGVMGQGFLLVEGDLRVQGQFAFYGVVIVRGSLANAGGSSIVGSVMAANVNLGENSLQGGAAVQYSSCATMRAQQAVSPGTLLRSRGWVQLY